MSLKDRIKAEGAALGFSFVGFAASDPPPHFANFIQWLGEGRHGSMEYLATERSRRLRSNPAELLPGCKTVVVVAVNYPSPLNFPSDEEASTGKIAAYAWTENDYHLVIAPLLEVFAQSICALLPEGVHYKCFVDTAPILERDFAQSAGLGWIGKNTCLISPQLGSFIFLAEILLDHYIEPDLPFTVDRCGSCTRCIEACPTQCILPDRTLDASRCISYLTIENKGPIPLSLRSKTTNWVFGCDICQTVCPWNHKTRHNPHPMVFKSVQTPLQLELGTELEIKSEDFKRKYHHSPILRAKRRGLLRNIAVAIGNSKDERMVGDLALALCKEEEPLVRAHLAWALGNLATLSARDALRNAKDCESDAFVLKEIKNALVQLEEI